MPSNTETPGQTPNGPTQPGRINYVKETTSPTLINDALETLPDDVQKKIKEVEKIQGITLPKPGEYWMKETFNEDGYPNGHYLSISCIENIEIVNNGPMGETLKFYCDRVKTRIHSKEKKLSHHKDTRGLEEVTGWLKNGILIPTTKENFDSYVEQAANQEIENN